MELEDYAYKVKLVALPKNRGLKESFILGSQKIPLYHFDIINSIEILMPNEPYATIGINMRYTRLNENETVEIPSYLLISEYITDCSFHEKINILDLTDEEVKDLTPIILRAVKDLISKIEEKIALQVKKLKVMVNGN